MTTQTAEHSVMDLPAHPQGPIAPFMNAALVTNMAKMLLSIAQQAHQAGNLEHMERAALRRVVAYGETAIRLSRDGDRITDGPADEKMGYEYAEPARTIIWQARNAPAAISHPDMLTNWHRDDQYSPYRRFLEVHAAGNALSAAISNSMRPLHQAWDAMDWEVRDGNIGACHRLIEEIVAQVREHGDIPSVLPLDAINDPQLQIFRQRTATCLEHSEAEIHEAAVRHQRTLRSYALLDGLSDTTKRVLVNEPLYPMNVRTLIQYGDVEQKERALYVTRFHSTMITGSIQPQVSGPFDDTQTIEIVANTVAHLATNFHMIGAKPDRRTVDAIETTVDQILASPRSHMTSNQRNRQRRTIKEIKTGIANLRNRTRRAATATAEKMRALTPQTHLTPIT